MTKILYHDAQHERAFPVVLSWMPKVDEEHAAAAYLLALDIDHADSLFDFDGDMIRPEGLCEPWQTGTSTRTTRLLFNLWNGWSGDENAYLCTPENLFCCEYAPVYWQAIKLRFPYYTE